MGVFDGYAGDAQAAAPVPVQPTQQPNNGGLLGSLYRSLIAPTVNAVGGGLSDITKIPESIGNAVAASSAYAKGDKKLANQIAQMGNQKLGDTNFMKNYTNYGDIQSGNASGGDFLGNAERSLGKGGQQALNIAAPVAGGEALAGKTGLAAIKAGAGVGAKYGALGGVTGAAAQGGGGEQLFAGGVKGGLMGAGTGALGGGAGALLSKVTSKSGAAAGDVAGAGSNATAAAQSGSNGILSKLTSNAGAKAANDLKAQQATDFAGATPTQVKSAMSYDKSGSPVGLNQVSNFMRGVNMPAHAQNMQVLHDTGTGVLGGNLQDIASGIPIDASNAVVTGSKAVQNDATRLGGLNKNLTGAAGDALRQIRSATDGLGESSTFDQVNKARSQLETAKSDLNNSLLSGNLTGGGARAARGQIDAYQQVIDHLNSQIDKSGVNKAVSNFKTSPDLQRQIHEDVTGNGGSSELAQHYINTLDNARTHGDVSSGMHIPTVAGKLSRVAKETYANAVPKETKGGSLGIPSWEIAASARNPAYLAAMALQLGGHEGIAGKVASKINPGAYEAAKSAALAPDAGTAGKLANPGGSSVPSAGTPELAPTPPAVPEVPSTPLPAPVDALPPSGATPTGQPTRLSFPATDTTTAIPTKTARGNVESLLQQIGVRRAVRPEPGPSVNGISGPVPNSGTTMGAADQPPTSIPVTAAPPTSQPLTASAEVPITTRVAPEPTPTGNGQASGEVPVTVAPPTPSLASQHPVAGPILDKMTRAGAAIDNAIPTPREAISALHNVPGAISSVAKNAQAKLPAPSTSATMGALTGQAASQVGQAQAGSSTTPPAPAPAPASAATTPADITNAASSDQSTPSMYSQANMMSDIQRDPKHMTEYLALYKELNPTPAATTGKVTAQQSGLAQTGLSSLAQMQAAITRDPSILAKANVPGQNIPLVGGYITGLTGAGDYTSAANNTLDALARLRTGAAMSKQEATFYHSLLPKAGDNADTINQKLTQLQQAFTQFAPTSTQ